MQAPSFLKQIMHCKEKRFSSSLFNLIGVFGVMVGPGIHVAQDK
jgi:hypothetical protein